ncbi:sensor histidine kinase [Pseudoxanthomonas winnipegensis]|uniref:Sensor histidine kinase n=1 Tax=Pseudoxanthomonas winnipegensis TaxID=2480810 RepID=A0A4Q8LKP5_9GAMM|nr:sensor histidine kinase [Pseudoxanthomonas winnipegensis]RZZ85041.1 sensor histidine kinase [Pseudoxanthomonas winnipegensis]TAA31089.1 sensor histidine kinase [Pseudoxanthomonas winnipegensis]TAA38600.1 sensor histidine kinase [Pseudoxanthomonas winnipegensis]TBV77634.1 sensor histidine kinase [Pseudoxanthomonas winnipegensis]
MTFPVPAWLRPAPGSHAAEQIAQGKSPWTEAIHLIWSAWVFVVPVFERNGFTTTWWLCTLVSYPLFLLLYTLTMVAPRRGANIAALGMVAMAAALCPVYPSAISYFIFGLLTLRVEGRHAFVRYLGIMLVLNAAFLAFALAVGYPWQMLVWLPISTIGTGLVIAVQQINRHKDSALRLSHDEVRRLAAVAERERIGRDLHDLLGHTLSLVALKSDLAARLVERDPRAARVEMDEVSRVAREALAQVRRAVSGIRSAQLAAELASAKLLLETDGIAMDYRVDGTPLPPAVETAFAMVLREAVTNVQRHARARTVHIAVAAQDQALTLRIHDDGRGSALVPGNGLDGMRARVQALGGTLQVDSVRGHGTTVLAHVPCASPVLAEDSTVGATVSSNQIAAPS